MVLSACFSDISKCEQILEEPFEIKGVNGTQVVSQNHEATHVQTGFFGDESKA